MKKSILLIGLGRFGRHMAQKLQDLHHQVLAIDSDEEKVNAALDYVTNAQIGDATSPKFLASLGVRDFDLCVVAIADDFEASLEITALLKELGARQILVQAKKDLHVKLLQKVGADQIIYPEKQMAAWAAVCCSDEDVFDYVQLTPDHSIMEISVPDSWVGKTLAQLDIRKKYRVNILGIKQNDILDSLPQPDHVFTENQTMLVLGENKDVQRLLKL